MNDRIGLEVPFNPHPEDPMSMAMMVAYDMLKHTPAWPPESPGQCRQIAEDVGAMVESMTRCLRCDD